MPLPLILASASPRRLELLRSLRISFEVIPSAARELHDPSVPVDALCELNAALKAAEVSSKHPGQWVLGADTLVTLSGRIYGKPASLQEAEQMLQELQGQAHQVITGLSLQQASTKTEHRFHERTEVRFKPLDANRIREYMAKVNVLDKAGAYAIQEHGEMIVEGITGSYSNVVGLPIELLGKKLQEIGLLAQH